MVKKRYDPVAKRWVNQGDPGFDDIMKPAQAVKHVAENTTPSTLTVAVKNVSQDAALPFKYDEAQIVADLHAYLVSTYGEHYKDDESGIECFDAWIALGDSGPTFRNTALKYLWRYGRKEGKNKKDLMKALHYICLLLYVDHYKDIE